MQIKVVNTKFQVRYCKSNNKLVILNDKYNIHLKIQVFKRKHKSVIRCRIKDKKTENVVLTKVFYYNDLIDPLQLKKSLTNYDIPKELEEIKQFIRL